MNKKLTLEEIASWQLNEKSEVKLPSVQRGFVWKPQQIENLWDSILREYPIGSFLLQKTSDTFYLMDGQQRATSIFLGFFNPYTSRDETKAWSIKGEIPVVWIDIDPQEKPEASKFLIRLTTRSHPWGYKAKDNGSKLSVSDRREALEIFRKNSVNATCGYTLFKNTTTFPFDACCPLPIAFFLESETIAQVIEKAKLFLPDNFCTKHGEFENKAEFINLLEKELKAKVEDILVAVRKIFTRTVNYDIVVDDVLKEEETQDNPTLFVRINSSGTTLTGNDLIYSIYKATFPESKDLVENAGMGFVAPTQTISLVSRLAWFELNEHKYPREMNVRDFQRNIKDESFRNKLLEIIGNKYDSKIEHLFEQAIKIIKCEDNLLFEGKIPPIMIKQYIKNSQELFLFFVCWLHIHGIPEGDELKLKIAAKLFSFAWFSFSNVPKLWEEIEDADFWAKPLNEYMGCNGTDGIHFLLPPDLLKRYYEQESIKNLFLQHESENHQYRWDLWHEGIGNDIKNYYNKIKSQEFEWDKANEYFGKFIEVLKNSRNKQLILFAQRNYINSEFGDYNQMDDLEDTNAPWDWDHIYPSEWVYRKVYCPQAIKDWNGTSGNFRAISLEQNRSESNSLSPKERLSNEIIRENSFISNDWEFWQHIEERIWSNEYENHFRAVVTRMINIYEKFWNDLNVGELIVLEEYKQFMAT